jgi:hypothetical protein
VAIAAGGWHTVALQSDGNVRAWGNNNYGQCYIPSDLGTCSSVAGGHAHTLAIASIAGPPPIDTDGDGRPDSIDNCPTIANPTQADCNNNGAGDACEIASGAPDCNANTIPDSCELAAGTAFDCNANTIPDSCDIASQGATSDCNLNTIPDACENDSRTVSTGNMGAFGAGVTAVGTLTGCVPSTTSVALRLDLIGDLSATTEYATLKVGGVTVGSLLFQTTGHDCPTTPDSVIIPITAAQWNNLLVSAATSGVITVEVLGSPLVSATQCANSSSALTVQYGGPHYDCDSNGVSDLCQIAAGAPDCNLNSIPDSCDLTSAAAADCNNNGVPDSCDITSGATDKDANGQPDDCQFAYGDFDLSGDIGGGDLGFLLAVWGTNSVIGDLDGDHIIGGGDLGTLLSRWGPVQ